MMQSPNRYPGRAPGVISQSTSDTNNICDFASAQRKRQALTLRSRERHDDPVGECAFLAELQRRYAAFHAGLFPLDGDKLIVSMPGGCWSTVPSLEAAHRLVKTWEAA